jgi:ketosteroid isomerase-like protein
MSQQNVDLTRQAYDALNRRDFDAFLALMDAGVEARPRVVAITGRTEFAVGGESSSTFCLTSSSRPSPYVTWAT